MGSAILLAHGPLQPGVSASLTQFVYQRSGRITSHEQHVDHEESHYFTRLAWDLDGFATPRDRVEREVRALNERLGLEWRLWFDDTPRRIAVFASRDPACLYEILSRCASGEWNARTALVVANRADVEPAARAFGVPFHLVPVEPATKRAAEERQLALVREAGAELIVLARYMQILSAEMIAAFEGAIINIHHAFLPAFPGGRPYQQAHARGVKLIGATSHYVTAELDAGPIIEQDVVRVDHRASVDELTKRGRDVEKVVLARAVGLHLDHKVIVHNGRTVVFG